MGGTNSIQQTKATDPVEPPSWAQDGKNLDSVTRFAPSIWTRNRRVLSTQHTEIIEKLPKAQFWPRSLQPWLVSLRRENSRELFLAGLWNLGLKLEAESRSDLALQTYRVLVEALSQQGESWEPELRKKVLAQDAALRGQGPWSHRLEGLGRHFVQDLAAPAPIAAFGLAWLAFHSARLTTLGRLAASPQMHLFTRGAGRRATAYLAGMAAESFTLPFALRSLDRRNAEDRAGFLRDWAQSALFLGAIRLSSGTFHALGSRVLAVRGGRAQSFLEFAGLYPGILLGQSLERVSGLRTDSDADPLVTGLFTLLQMQTGQHLARGIWGPRFAFLTRAWEVQAESFSSPTQGRPGLATAWLSSPAAFKPPHRPSRSHILEMSSKEDSRGPSIPPDPGRIKHRESQFRNGTLRIEMETEKGFTQKELDRRLQGLDNGICALLLGYTARAGSKMTGAVAKLLEANRELAEEFLLHLEQNGNRLLAQVDYDTWTLQRLIALDATGTVQTMILQAPEGEYALRLSLHFSRPTIPYLMARKYTFAPGMLNPYWETALTDLRYNGIPHHESFEEPRQQWLLDAPKLEISLTAPGEETSSSDHAVMFEIFRLPRPWWRIEDGFKEKLLSIDPRRFGNPDDSIPDPLHKEPPPRPSIQPRSLVRSIPVLAPSNPVKNPEIFPPPLEQDLPTKVPSAPPLPTLHRKKAAKPPQTPESAAQERPTHVERPAPTPSSSPKKKSGDVPKESKAFRQSLAALRELTNAAITPARAKKLISQLRSLGHRLPMSEFRALALEASEHTARLFQLKPDGIDLLGVWIKKSPPTVRITFCHRIAEFLISDVPRDRSWAFALLRDNLGDMNREHLVSLQTLLNEKFPPSKYPLSRRLMVEQVEKILAGYLGV